MSFIRIFFAFIFLFNFAEALNIKDLGFQVFLISNNSEFKMSNNKIKNKILQNYQLKIITDKTLTKGEIYYLKIHCDIDNITKSTTDYQSELENIIIKIDTKSPKIINIFFTNQIAKKVNIIINPIHIFEFEMFYKDRNIISGISYGIIFCAFLYSLITYFNTRFRSFLYYSLMQLLIFISLLQNYYFSSKAYTFANEEMNMNWVIYV